MREMKDSGIEWIGEIPQNWKMIQLKNVIKERAGGAWGENPRNDKNDRICLRVTDFAFEQGKFKHQKKDSYTSRSYNSSQIWKTKLKPGDILVEKSGGGEKSPVGHAVLYDLNFEALYANFMDRIRVNLTKVTSEFFLYFWRAMYYSSITKLYINQTTGIQNLNLAKLLSNEYIPIPSLTIQKHITDYLDAKCAEIDSLTADIQEQIDVLKQYKKSVITEAVTKGLDPNAEMKDSGIEWIGEIPAYWHTSKIKYISSFSPSCNLSSLKHDSLVGYSPMDCIKDGYQVQLSKIYFDIPKSLTPYQNGDIVMAKVTPCFENGNIAIMENTPSGIGFGSSELFVFRATNIKQKYLFYWLRNSKFKDVAASTMTGTSGLRRVSSSFVSNSDILVPPNQEQESIADYLDKKCNEIDELISTKQDQLETLSEYKKSLIYEYVTGKKEVPAK